MFDEKIKFKYQWRDYQTKVLDNAQQFINDGHIHVVAAPGSGKTVLGLELMRRINLPTIILAPTIAIRNQWAERFTTLFMDNATGKMPEWLSLDANKPAKLTVITYQGLYSALAGKKYKQEQEAALEDSEDESADEATILEAPDDVEEPQSDEIVVPAVAFGQAVPVQNQPPQPQSVPQVSVDPKAAAFLKKLNELGIRNIIVDEAHHLRNDWWRSLHDLQAGLQNPVVIALTATPPYDAEPTEWRKYQEFCGPIDIEVSVPELVARGDLCPHQDYVCLSMLSDAETQSAKEIKEKIKTFVEALKIDQEFISTLLQHPVFMIPQNRDRLVFEDPEYYTAVGSFLLAIGQKKAGKPLLRLISGRNYGIMPKFKEQEAEILLQNVLYRDAYFADEAHETLTKRLKEAGSRAGVIEARRVSLTDNKSLSLILKNSVSKLQSVRRIVTFEQAAFGHELRCVVLTDFIRQEYLPPTTKELNKLGVVPIFETLRTSIGKTSTNKIGVLCGGMVVIPAGAKEVFMKHMQDVARDIGASAPKLSFHAYPTDDEYLVCSVSDQTRQFLVQAVTQTFEEGDIEILIGTKSLLGEGWDAPAINSLVLASVVGTFMLSNQMRGRAIRTDKDNPNKVANIWHIATVLPGARQIIGPLTVATDDLGPEFDLLARRFETFVGINARQDSIESGLNRALYLNRGPYKIASLGTTIEQANTETFEAARDKLAVSAKWQRTLQGDKVGQLVHTVQMDQPKLPRGFVYTETLKAALIALVYNWLAWVQAAPQLLGRSSASDPRATLLFIVGIIGVVSAFTLLKFIWYLIIAVRHFSPEGSISQVGEALLRTLTDSKAIKTPAAQLEVVANKAGDGTVSCGLKGGTTFENDLFLDSLEELLSPIANPRYLLQSGGKYRFIHAGYNNYAVPALLGQRKQTVLAFLAQWKRRVGPCRGVYTRTQEGRMILLKARRESLSGRLSSRSTRHSVWT